MTEAPSKDFMDPDWVSYEEAIAYIMQKTGADRESAVASLELFEQTHPESVMPVTRN